MYLIYSQLLCKCNLLNHKFPWRKNTFIENNENYKSAKLNSNIYDFINIINKQFFYQTQYY